MQLIRLKVIGVTVEYVRDFLIICIITLFVQIKLSKLLLLTLVYVNSNEWAAVIITCLLMYTHEHLIIRCVYILLTSKLCSLCFVRRLRLISSSGGKRDYSCMMSRGPSLLSISVGNNNSIETETGNFVVGQVMRSLLECLIFGWTIRSATRSTRIPRVHHLCT